jgi:hypothetical protein
MPTRKLPLGSLLVNTTAAPFFVLPFVTTFNSPTQAVAPIEGGMAVSLLDTVDQEEIAA